MSWDWFQQYTSLFELSYASIQLFALVVSVLLGLLIYKIILRLIALVIRLWRNK